MAKVVMTWKRDDSSKYWVLPNTKTISKGVFSLEESNYLLETKDIYESLPGYVASSVVFLDEYTYTFSIEFDTQQSAQSAYDILSDPPVDSAFYIRRQIVDLKRKQLGFNYTFTIELA